MSVGSVLNTARGAMNAQQLAIQVASQNIANAGTEGYSRQRVELGTSLEQVYPWGTVGTGVDVKSITRARDTMLDANFRRDSSSQAYSETTTSALSQMQAIFAEPSDSGLSAAIDAFWSSWNDLASDPTNGAAKAAVRAAGDTLATTLNRFASQLDALNQTNRASMGADIGQVNQLTKQVSDYNRQIVAAEANGNTAGDLRDARDRLLDQLSSLTGGSVVERSNGSVAFFAAGRMILDGTSYKTFDISNAQPPVVTIAGETQPITGLGGSLGAKMDVSATHIPNVMGQLDTLANMLVTTVNAAHNGGTTYSGNPSTPGVAGNFFEVSSPSGAADPYLTARGISLASTLSSADDVAAAGAGAPGPGNNSVATAVSAMRDTLFTITSANGSASGTNSIGGYFTQVIGDLATSARYAEDDATVQRTLAGNSATQRSSVSSVSTDEELIGVIQHQHAYQAAARLVSIVDEMTDTLVNLGR